MRRSTRHLPSRGGTLRRIPPGSSPADGVASGISASGPDIRALRRCLKRRGERGAAILETLLSLLFLMLILFGALQIFQLALAQMVADYSAFRGARSISVGFSPFWAAIEAKVKSVPASGHILIPNKEEEGEDYFTIPDISLYWEEDLLTEYMEQDDDYKDLKYTLWDGDEIQYHTDYRCTYYGRPSSGRCPICHPKGSSKPYVSAKDEDNGRGRKTHFEFTFNHYPLTVPLHWILVKGKRDVTISGGRWNTGDETGYVELANHSVKFLE